jgi:hypothetical protein
MSWNDRKIRPSIGGGFVPPDGAEVRNKRGDLAGWQEDVPTLGGVSTTHVWATCIACGRRLMVDKKKVATELAHHRASRFGGKADACGGPVVDWIHISDRPKEIARERGFDWLAWLGWHPPMPPPHFGDEVLALGHPFRAAFGEAWRARYWHCSQAQIEADYVRAIAALLQYGILEPQ